MIKLAYLILADRCPTHLIRLVDRLEDGQSWFFIHWDLKAAKGTREELWTKLSRRKNLRFVDPRACVSRDFSWIEGTLAGIRSVLESQVPFDYVALLSGEDYPIRSRARILAHLDSKNGQELIPHFSLAAKNLWDHQGIDSFSRLRHPHLKWGRLNLRLRVARRFPEGFEPFGGTKWWCLTLDCLKYIEEYVRLNPEYSRYFKRVYSPEEIFFQTLILNSRFRNRVMNEGLDHDSRELIGLEDFDALTGSSALFARRFDDSNSLALLDRIDRELLIW